MILLIHMLVYAQDAYRQHKFDVGKTRQKFHVTLKTNVDLKRQRPSKVHLLLKEKLEKLLTKLWTQVSCVKCVMTTRWSFYLLIRSS